MSDPGSPQAVLVTVVGPTRRADVSLPATAAVAEMLPAIVDMVAAGPGASGSAWGLAPLGRQALAPEATLEDSGVADGAVLYLRPLSPDRPEAFIAVSSSFLDEEDDGDVEEVDAHGPRHGWTAVARSRSLVVAAAISGAGVVAILAATTTRPDSQKAGICIGGALALLFTLTLLRLAGAAPEARDALSACAVVLGSGAAWWLTATPAGASTLLDRLTLLGVAVAVGGLIMAVAAPSALAASLALIGGFGAVAARLADILGPPVARTAAPVAIAALVAMRAAPAVAATLSRPLRLAGIVTSAPPDDPSGELTAAQHLLTWLVRGLAVVLALSLVIVDASLDEPFAVVAGVCGSLALLLQSLRFRFLADGLPLFAAALAGIGALEGALVFRWVHEEAHPIRAAALAGGMAVILCVGGAAIGAGASWRREDVSRRSRPVAGGNPQAPAPYPAPPAMGPAPASAGGGGPLGPPRA